MTNEQIYGVFATALVAEIYAQIALKGFVQSGMMSAAGLDALLDAMVLPFEQLETHPEVGNGIMFRQARERITAFVASLSAIEAEGIAMRAAARASQGNRAA